MGRSCHEPVDAQAMPRLLPVCFPCILSPPPQAGHKLEVFLADLCSKKGIDLTFATTMLGEKDFTPNVIPHLARNKLVDLLNKPPGTVMKVQVFAQEWNAQLVEKQAN